MITHVDATQGELSRLRNILRNQKFLDADTIKKHKKRINYLVRMRDKRELKVKRANVPSNVLPFKVIQQRQEQEYKRELKNIEREIFGYDD